VDFNTLKAGNYIVERVFLPFLVAFIAIKSTIFCVKSEKFGRLFI